MIDRDHCLLYEVYRAFPVNGGASWRAENGGVFNLTTVAQAHTGKSTSIAAGISMTQGLVRYDEVVEKGVIPHALVFAVSNTRRAYVPPARSCATTAPNPTDPALPPMGIRMRLKPTTDVSRLGRGARVVATALMRFGMILTDNSGPIALQLNGTNDARWDTSDLSTLVQLHASDFEVLRLGAVSTNCP